MRPTLCALFGAMFTIAACGGGGASAGGSSTSDSARGGQSGPEGCTGHDPAREAVCLSEGCRWGESLLCMGTPPPDDRDQPPRPCDCICADDEEQCRNVPSAPPGPAAE